MTNGTLKKNVFIVGSEPLREWEKRNGNPTSISIKGKVSGNIFLDLSAEFDYKKYKHISLDELDLLDFVRENNFACPFDEFLSYRIWEDAVRVFVLNKIFLNSQTTKDFVVSDDCVFTTDYKTLVHVPEAKSVVIPTFVQHIGIAACSGYEDMLDLHLNEGLKSIEKWAFVGAGISRLDLPDTVISLGEDAFRMADLENVRLSNALEAIPDGCFNLCNIEKISIPSSVKTIGNGSLRSPFLYEIDIPEGVEQIGHDAFEGMDRVSLPSTLKKIAPDFYYEECIDDPDTPPFITVHPDNKTFVSKNGSLYFRDSGKLALDSEYHGRRFD